MTRLTWPKPPDDFAEQVQVKVDELEFLWGSAGETSAYLAFADHLDAALVRGAPLALIPPDSIFWSAVAAECRRRDAGIVTEDNADRLRLIEE